MAGLPGSTACAQAATAPHPQAFAEDGPLTSDAGNFMIAWESDATVTLELASPDRSARPSLVYRGPNKSLFLTGLRDGEYELRMRDASGAQTDTLGLIVQHQSLARAMWLVALGALAFIATVAVIVRGPRDE